MTSRYIETEAQQRPQVLIVGDLVLDRYDVDGQIFEKLGCAANIFAALDHTRFDRTLYASFADPRFAQEMLRGVVHTDTVEIRPATGARNIVLYGVEAGAAVQLVDAPQAGSVAHDLTILADALRRADILVVCDHQLGTATPEVQAMVRARGNLAHSYVDCRHGNYEDYRGLECLLPNAVELVRLERSGRALKCATDVSEAGFRQLFCKMGADGVRWIGSERDEIMFSPEVEVKDDFGAGDYLIAELINSHGIASHAPDKIAAAMSRVTSRLRLVGGGLLRPPFGATQVHAAATENCERLTP